MIYIKIAEQLRYFIKVVDQWKACNPGNRKPPYVKLYSDYVKFTVSCKTLRLTNPNKYIDRIESIWSELIEWMKAISQFEEVAENFTVEENENGVRILRQKFHDAFGVILDSINQMCGQGAGRFLIGALYCYCLMTRELAADLSLLDLEEHRRACKVLDDLAEKTYEPRVNEIVDNICGNLVDAIEAIDGYRVNKGLAISRARHYRETEDSIKGVEDDIDLLLEFYIKKASK